MDPKLLWAPRAGIVLPKKVRGVGVGGRDLEQEMVQELETRKRKMLASFSTVTKQTR